MRAVIYKRVSTLGQVQDGVSLDLQEERLSAYIKGQGWDLLYVYEDAGLSGSDTNRPAFQQMMEDAKNGNFDCIVVYKLDRLTRSVKDFHDLAEQLDKLNISLVSVTQSIDTSTPAGKLMRNILVDFANFEREMTIERVMDNKYSAAQKGLWLGGYLPPGYKWSSTDKKTRKIIIDEEKAELVKAIFNDYINGLSDKALSRKYTMFTIEPIRKMLQNPMYIGKIAYGKKPVKNKKRVYAKPEDWIIADSDHEPLIDKETFDRVRQIRKERNNVPSPRKTQQIFTGVVYCGGCGQKMYFYNNYQILKGDIRKDYKYYKCNSWYKSGCHIKTHEHVITEAILILFDKLEDMEFVKELLNSANENNSNINKTQLKHLEKQLSTNQTKIKNLVNKLALEDMDAISKILAQEIKNLQTESDALQKEINALNTVLKDSASIVMNFQVVHGIRVVWEQMDTKEKEYIVKLIVKQINIFENEIQFIINSNTYMQTRIRL